MLMVAKKFRWCGRDYLPGDLPPANAPDEWMTSWLDSGAITGIPPDDPPRPAPKAILVAEPGEEVLTARGAEVTDRLPTAPRRKRKA